jgi:hypothetical protein
MARKNALYQEELKIIQLYIKYTEVTSNLTG